MDKHQSHAVPSALDDFNQLLESLLLRVLVGQMPADALNDAGVVLRALQHVGNLFVGVLLGQHQLQRRFAINLVDVCIVEVEQGEGIGRGGLEASGGDDTHAQ